MNLLAQVAPQVVGEAGIPGMAIAKPLTTCGIDRFVDRIDDLRNLDAFHVAGQLIATARATHTGNQIAPAQLGEQLFEVGQGYALPLGNISQRHWPVLRVQCGSSMAVTAYRPLVVSRMAYTAEVRNEGEYAIPE